MSYHNVSCLLINVEKWYPAPQIKGWWVFPLCLTHIHTLMWGHTLGVGGGECGRTTLDWIHYDPKVSMSSVICLYRPDWSAQLSVTPWTNHIFTVSVHVCVKWHYTVVSSLPTLTGYSFCALCVLMTVLCPAAQILKKGRICCLTLLCFSKWHWLTQGGTTVTGETKVAYLSLIGLDGGFCSGRHVDCYFVMYCMNSKWICGTSCINFLLQQLCVTSRCILWFWCI